MRPYSNCGHCRDEAIQNGPVIIVPTNPTTIPPRLPHNSLTTGTDDHGNIVGAFPANPWLQNLATEAADAAGLTLGTYWGFHTQPIRGRTYEHGYHLWTGQPADQAVE